MKKLWNKHLPITRYMMSNRKEDLYKKYLSTLLGFETEIIDVIIIDNFEFVFYMPKGYFNPYDNEQLNYITNLGPLRINTTTGEYSIIGAVQFLMDYGDREEYLTTVKDTDAPDYQRILLNIKMRSKINWSEFDEVLNLFLGEDIYRNVTYELKPQRTLEILIEDAAAKEIILTFLKDISANYSIENNNKYIVNLDIS